MESAKRPMDFVASKLADSNRKRKFREVWLTKDEYKEWLTPVEGKIHLARCLYCHKVFGADHTSVKRHMESQIHNHNKKFKPSFDIKKTPVGTSHQKPDLDEMTTRAEIKIAAFFIEHNISLQIADKFVDFLRDTIPCIDILKKIQLKRTKISSIIGKVGLICKDNMLDKLRKNKFTLIVDESIDNCNKKNMAIVARFFDSSEEVITTKFLEFIDLSASEYMDKISLGIDMNGVVLNFLNTNNIPLDNMIGFMTNCGSKNSVKNVINPTFKKNGVLSLKCNSNSLHLSFLKAVEVFPELEDCKEALKSVYSFFNNGSKTRSELVHFKEFRDVKTNKLLNQSPTKWLLLQEPIKLLIKEWNPLLQYLEKNPNASSIVEKFVDPSLYFYFQFLNFILPMINDTNLIFQRQGPTVHICHEKIKYLFMQILSCYYNRHKLKKVNLITDVNISFSPHFHPDDKIFLGAKIHELSQMDEYKNEEGLLENVRLSCRNFLISFCTEIQDRFAFNENFFKISTVFSPANFLNPISRSKYPTLVDLVKIIPNVYKGSIDELDYEWRLVDIHKVPKELLTIKNPEKFYHELSKIEDNNYQKRFYNISNFARIILSIPISNGDVERLFTKVNLTRTKLRMGMKVSTMTSLLYLSEAVKQEKSCVQFNPTIKMINEIKRSERCRPNKKEPSIVKKNNVVKVGISDIYKGKK